MGLRNISRELLSVRGEYARVRDEPARVYVSVCTYAHR